MVELKQSSQTEDTSLRGIILRISHSLSAPASISNDFEFLLTEAQNQLTISLAHTNFHKRNLCALSFIFALCCRKKCPCKKTFLQILPFFLLSLFSYSSSWEKSSCTCGDVCTLHIALCRVSSDVNLNQSWRQLSRRTSYLSQQQLSSSPSGGNRSLKQTQGLWQLGHGGPHSGVL